ncbi:hypothetical protein BKA93DRAFT_823954 [Sparassis latifolia]|uniref:Protein scd2/ral3 n=1 Tax=Sparassis crispa TaxID=139825 RepID=A0A401GAH4_9APHY|nr:Protein scd2/ral3 [Sparassis crispa]GBE79149.1 Protein scd2/ral3 [Sparassis crispa]
MMKTLRKSLSHKDHVAHISQPSALPSLSKPPSAILPPKKVIRALNSYKSRAPQELSFEKGDFFHVINDVNNAGSWYEAHNPMTGARGLVPCCMFEEFQKGTPIARVVPAATSERPLSTAPKLQAYYAVVLHDFVAERADELDARAGDPVTVVAQSNREWFVAKPIGRLGRPGLIPVSFVELRDPANGQAIPDVNGLIDSGALPRVEEWKRAMMSYKANSISLGVLEETPRVNVMDDLPKPQLAIVVQGPTPPAVTHQQQLPAPADILGPATPKSLPEGILLSADVKSFHYEMEEYWFRVHALFQPYDPSGSNALPPARQLVLFRSYNDFYDFQVELLETFPQEAGRPDHASRILPYMPGPADQVDNEITGSRRAELDDYVHRLCALSQYASYILEHRLIRMFLAPKPGDAELEVGPRVEEIEALARSSYENQQNDEQADLESDVRTDQLARMQIAEKPEEPTSDGSDYEEEADILGRPYEDTYKYRPDEHAQSGLSSSQTFSNTAPLRPKPRIPVDERAEASTSIHGRSGTTTSYQQRSYPQSIPSSSSGNGAGGRLLEAQRSHSSLEIDPYYNNPVNTHSRSSVTSSHEPSPTSMRSSRAGSIATSGTSNSGRSRSQSNATHNPPISSTNSQTAFIKIKIFDRMTDDLVAIRVHPRVTHAQLLDKVQARLGGNALNLRYRDSTSNEFVDLEGDDELRSWLDSTERHVLYAE